MMSMFNLVTSACLVLVNSVHCERRRGSLYLLSRERLATESFQARSPRYNGTSEGGRREDHGCGRQQLEEGGQLDMVRCGEENSPGRAPPACSRWRGREEGSGFRCP